MSSLLRGSPAWDCHVHVFDACAPTLRGHYVPAEAPLRDVEHLASLHGIERLVLVQPSVYGTDNAVMEAALRASGGRHRGVAVVSADIDDAALDRLWEAGVRGVRFNRVSPVGNDDRAFTDLAPRLRARGFHVQWYVKPSFLPHLVELQRRTGLTFVLDHLAGLHVGDPVLDAAWIALEQLANAGAWVKLSGWYRLGAAEPYAELLPHIRRVGELLGDHLVWGSDWPHTSLPSSKGSRFSSLLEPVALALGEARLQRCLSVTPRLLYDQ